MARSPILSAYLATLSPTERGLVGPQTPPRPNGAVVWAVCAEPDQLSAVATLFDRLTEDGEMISMVPTLPKTDDPKILLSPNTRRSTRAFLDHWKPQVVIWFGGTLDAAPLMEIQQSKIPNLLVEANFRDIEKTGGRRVPGLMRSLLAEFSGILTLDAETSSRLIKAGSDIETTQVAGALEDGVAPPDYQEAERADLSETLGSRPMWFAADVPMQELKAVAAAHRHAARRAHRTLLILAPRNTDDGARMTQTLRADGFSVACRSANEGPRESTQIFVADTDDGLGLWCRLAPITYLGGSLTDGQICDPFAPATVGSAVLAGPRISRFRSHYDRLLTAGALHSVASEGVLGRAVESLLATDLAAQLAHSAWDVTSRGADATNKLVALIYKYLDKVDS